MLCLQTPCDCKLHIQQRHCVNSSRKNCADVILECMKSPSARMRNKKDKEPQCEKWMLVCEWVIAFKCACVNICVCVCVCRNIYLWACLCVITVLGCWIIQCPPSANTNTNRGEPLKIHEEIITGHRLAFSSAPTHTHTHTAFHQGFIWPFICLYRAWRRQPARR